MQEWTLVTEAKVWESLSFEKNSECQQNESISNHSVPNQNVDWQGDGKARDNRNKVVSLEEVVAEKSLVLQRNIIGLVRYVDQHIRSVPTCSLN